MISNEKEVNYKVAGLFNKYHNFGLGHSPSDIIWKIQKNWFQIICTSHGLRKMQCKYIFASGFLKVTASVQILYLHW